MLYSYQTSPPMQLHSKQCTSIQVDRVKFSQLSKFGRARTKCKQDRLCISTGGSLPFSSSTTQFCRVRENMSVASKWLFVVGNCGTIILFFANINTCNYLLLSRGMFKYNRAQSLTAIYNFTGKFSNQRCEQLIISFQKSFSK